MYEIIKKRVFSLEESLLWEIAIIISVIMSVFGPPVAVLMDLSISTIIYIVIIFNIIFFFDLFIKIWKYKKQYIFSIDILIDLSAIVSAVLELMTFTNTYSGTRIANLRILRALKLLGRVTKTTKSIIKFGQINKLSRGTAESIEKGNLTLLKTEINQHISNKQTNEISEIQTPEKIDLKNKEVRFLQNINAKMHTVLMILMTYIIFRFGSIPENYTLIQEAKFNIAFFIEIIILMFIIGGVIDYFLQKLIGERFENIKKWVKAKSQQHGFFQDVHDKAFSVSKDEVSFLEQYIGIVLEKAAAFPISYRKLIWGQFKPEEKLRIIFLSDIETYSKITADMTSKEINNLLDEYINKVVEILVFYGAEVDKYVGDSIIVYFPTEKADFVLDAMRDIFNLEFSYNLKTRIGLHAGKVIETYVGPYGYKQMDHFSEEISITQRVEDYNKKTKSYLLMTEDFVNLLSEEKKKEIKYHGIFKPKGANRKIKIYKHKELSEKLNSKTN
jgi:class 3 adenylate cyclase